MICPSSRAAALTQLDGFIPLAGFYARDRNHVKPGHPSVSRLSPAIRHRLITEQEVVGAVLRDHSFGRVQKFIQEVYWRRYWKSWIALRPQVWSDYLISLREMDVSLVVRSIENAQSGNVVIDHFIRELVTTGYLHNHARMWFAAWWVHEARLPWQAGAAFFFSHLLDGDPASNTLSWRWVAGLQTPGKTYLARRSNLEKYLAPELVASLTNGLAAFENPQSLPPELVGISPMTRADGRVDTLTLSEGGGLWIHEEDLAAENSSLAKHAFSTVLVTADVDSWKNYAFTNQKIDWISAALHDACIRAEQHWQVSTKLETKVAHGDMILQWAKFHRLQQVVTLRPEVGPLNDSLPALHASLVDVGIRLILIDRPEDLQIRQFASGGFFQFWERVQKSLFAQPIASAASKPQQLWIDFPQ
jgi:deoxyribodipyrimidine photo-lyase